MAIEETNDLLMRVNPVPMTAQVAVYLMSYAGIPDAQGICADLGIDAENVMPKESALVGDVLLGNAMVVESKYRAMLGIIEASQTEVCVDLPSGYTPKAIHLTEAGRRFVGLDLPVVAADATKAILPKVKNPARASFHGVDATNYESLRQALADVSGELCISTEGMMMYFTESEANEVVENVCRLLEEHGGCWITPDPEVSLHFMAAFRALGPDAMQQLLSTRAAAQESSDAVITNSLLVNPQDVEASTKRALAFLTEHHLEVERIPMGAHMPDLAIYERLSAEQVAAFKEAMAGCTCWKMTLAHGAERTFELGRDFRCTYGKEGARLSYALAGRLDTISAPELLGSFEKEQATTDIRSVLVDLRELDYVSSAGIRVLLMMHKRCPDGVRIVHASGVVADVLEQTGFQDLLG